MSSQSRSYPSTFKRYSPYDRTRKPNRTYASKPRKSIRPMRTYDRTVMVSPKKFWTNAAASSAAITKGAIAFTLSGMVDDYLSAANVFDQYRITKAKVFFIPQTQPQANASSGVGYATLCSALDYDDTDVSSYTTVNELLQFDSSLIHPQYEPVIRALVPRTAATVNQSGTGVPGAMGGKGQWLDCAYPSIQHYGVKYIIAQCTSTNVPSWDIFVQVFVEFRNKH